MHEMTPDEQQQYVTHLRSLRTSAQSFAKALTAGAPKPTKSKSSKPAINVDLLAGEYDV